MTSKRRRNPGPISSGDDAVSQVKWEPPPGKVKYDWAKIATRLRSKPGEWAQVYAKDRVTVANAVRSGSIKHVRPADGFEVRTANTDTLAKPPVCSLYLRYTGKD